MNFAATPAVNRLLRMLRDFVCLEVYIAAWCFAFWIMRYGLDWHDEPYQILNGLTVWQNSPLAPLSAILTGLFARVSHDILWFRYVGMAFYGAAILILTCYACRRFWQITLWAGICTALSALDWRWLYSWDTYSWFLVSVQLLLLLVYLRRRRQGLLWAMAVVGSLSILVRVPDVLAVVFVTLSIWLYDPSAPRRRSQALLYFCICVALSAIFILAMYGSPGDYLTALGANRLTAHANVLLHPVSGFMYMAPTLMASLGCVVTVRCFERRLVSDTVYWLFVAIFALFTCCMIWWAKGSNIQFYTALSAVMLGCLQMCQAGDARQKRLAVILLAMVLSTAIGSNTGLYKSLAYPVLPLIYMWLRPVMNRRLLNSLTVIAIVGMVFAGYETNRRYSFDDHGFSRLDTQLTSTRNVGIYTSRENAQLVNDIDSLMRPLIEQGRHPVIYGRQQWLWGYMFDYINPWYHHDWDDMMNNPTSHEYDVWFVNEMSRDPRAVILVPPYQPVDTFISDYLRRNYDRQPLNFAPQGVPRL